jgi:hypothetical protein
LTAGVGNDVQLCPPFAVENMDQVRSDEFCPPTRHVLAVGQVTLPSQNGPFGTSDDRHVDPASFETSTSLEIVEASPPLALLRRPVGEVA